MIELKPLNIVGVEPIEGPVALPRELKKLYTDCSRFSDIGSKKDAERKHE